MVGVQLLWRQEIFSDEVLFAIVLALLTTLLD